MRVIVGFLGLVSLVGAGAACSSTAEDREAEAQLETSYLAPLAQAGLEFQVTEVCHYARESAGELWHFQVTVAIDADSDRVMDALSSEVDVIVRDRDPILIQQYRDEPGRGWDGSLTSAGDATALALVRNNVSVDGQRPSVAWLQVCDSPT